MRVSKELMEKYNTPGPRYTSYPPANFFAAKYDTEQFKKDLISSNDNGDKNISLYIHIPYCPKICHFCGCNTVLIKQKDVIERYINAVIKEIKTYSALISKDRKVTQIHWGGGTPNSISMKFVKQIMDCINEEFILIHNPEIAMECSPAYMDFQQVDELVAMGFNRLSLGIQDFDEEILMIVNRKPSKLPVNELVNKIKEAGINSVNLDFIYGLPGQTTNSFNETIKKAIEISPERLVTFSYAHVPWVKEQQKKLEEIGLPSPEDKLNMFLSSLDLLTENGYKSIGMDHYAKKGDELYKAYETKNLHRNFQGYCTKETTGQVYAFGTSSISQLWGAYSQNEKDVSKYIEMVEDTGFAVSRGYKLSEEEMICREVINEIMCNGLLDMKSLASQYAISVEELKQIITFSKSKLKDLEEDGLITITDDNIEVSEIGRLFVRNIAMVFDPKLSVEKNQYSKTI